MLLLALIVGLISRLLALVVSVVALVIIALVIIALLIIVALVVALRAAGLLRLGVAFLGIAIFGLSCRSLLNDSNSLLAVYLCRLVSCVTLGGSLVLS